MEIIEETIALGIPFCHFRTLTHKNQYNLTFTKKDDLYEVHLVPLIVSCDKGRVLYDKDLRNFVCDKVFEFMQKNKCKLYFSINCIGKENERLVWKILRWIRFFKHQPQIQVFITEDTSSSIRFFEFYINY